jgi:uncharacterized protein (DUF488 family)
LNGVAHRVALWTVGHSNQTLDEFFALLAKHAIEVVVDVRSSPFSRYADQFNRQPLERAVRATDLHYIFMGRELGGRPDDEAMYDQDGHVSYRAVAQSPEFTAGIVRIREGIRHHRVCLMCAEEDPTGCHRRLLVGKVLTDAGVCVLRHIRGGSQIEDEDAVRLDVDPQLSLLGEEVPWRSIRSVLPRSLQPPSSTH